MSQMTKRTTYLTMSVLLSATLCIVAMGKTIYVDDGSQANFDNIQVGIDSAENGDTVLVAPGEYVIAAPITFRGKAITVRAEAGPDETTIRMSTPADNERGSVVIFENNETTSSVLDGFTITGGKGSWVSSANAYAGGGIYFDASSGSLMNCAVVKNRADDGGGGGVSAGYGSSPTLTNCIFTGNSATWGGGVLGWINSSITMTNCVISGNSSLNLGGGVYGGSNSSITMTNCTIISNTVQDAGAGIVCDSSSAILTNCVIAQNTGARWGGGLCSGFPLSSITISNCTIWGNSATEGGGVGCLNGGSATVTNSIFWGNTASRGNEIFLEESPTRFSVAYSNVAGGQAGSRVQGGSTLDWGPGNIDADPLFAKPGYWAEVNDLNVVVEPDDPNAVWIDGDYHLKSEAGRWDPVSESWIVDDVTSQCIDAGDPNTPISDEPEPNGGVINMGAYGGTNEASKSDYTWWFATTEGPITAEGLGIILPHEHIFTDLRGPTSRTYGQADAADVVRVMGPLLEEARQKGVGLLIECSSIGVGRNVSIIAQVAEASGLPVVVPTGVYGRANFAPPEHRNMSEDELTTLFINEIREGIDGTDIKAGFIKIATGNGPMTALEEKFLRAAGRAASETGAAIASHTPIGSNASRQADILGSISPAIRLIWVHAQNESNRSLHRQLAERGVFIELDSLGWNPGQDSRLITAIKELLAAGYGDRILLSHDAGWYQPGEQNGGTQMPYTYLIETFIPKLRKGGVDDEAIRMITETNPIRAFGFNSNE